MATLLSVCAPVLLLHVFGTTSALFAQYDTAEFFDWTLYLGMNDPTYGGPHGGEFSNTNAHICSKKILQTTACAPQQQFCVGTCQEIRMEAIVSETCSVDASKLLNDLVLFQLADQGASRETRLLTWAQTFGAASAPTLTTPVSVFSNHDMVRGVEPRISCCSRVNALCPVRSALFGNRRLQQIQEWTGRD